MSYNLNCIDTMKFLKSINRMIVVVDKDLYIISASTEFYIITEYSENELVGKKINNIISGNLSSMKDNELRHILNVVIKSKSNKYLYASMDELYFDFEHDVRFFIITRQSPQELFNAIILESDENENEFISYIKDLNGNIVYANSNFENFLNMKKSDILGKKIRDVYKCERDDTYLRWIKEDEYIINTNEAVTTFESMIIDEEIRYIKVKKKPIRNKYGNTVGLYCMIKDFTKEIMLKNDLMLKNEQLSIINEILEVSCLEKLDMMLDDLLEKLCVMYKISWISIYIFDDKISQLEFLVAKGLSKAYCNNYIKTKKNMELINHIFYNSLKTTEFNNKELEMYKKPIIEDEKNITYINSYQMVDNNKIIGMINYGSINEKDEKIDEGNFFELISNAIGCILNNILSKLFLEKNLKKQIINNKQMDMFFNTSIDLLCIINYDNTFLRVGCQMLKDLGYEEDELIHKPVFNIVHPEDKKIMENIVQDSSQIKELCLRMLKKDDTYINIAWNTNYIEEEKIYICSGRNLTNEIILEQKKMLAENFIQIERAKTEFLSNMEHELRTPITIIDGSLKLISNYISKSESDYQIFKYIESATKNTYRMKRLVNNIIEITNYDARSIIPDKNYYNIIGILNDIVASLNEYLKPHNVEIDFSTSIDKYILYIDPLMIERVILNLVSNSVKYKKDNIVPKINIRVFFQDGTICVGVADNGIGIMPEEVPYLFERFCMLNEVMTKKAEGSGMGLYIVKNLLHINNAKISVNTEKLSGTEFIIEFMDQSFEDKAFIKKEYTVLQENFDMEFSDIYF